MADIVIAMLEQPGHILPTLQLGASLSLLGHTVRWRQKALPSEGGSHPDPLCMDDADAPLEEIKADLILVDKVLAEHRIDRRRMRSRHLAISTSLLDWREPTSLPADEPLLVLCPAALEVEKFRYPREQVFYTDACVGDMGCALPSRPDTPAVLCAFGTQSIRHGRLAAHYELVYALARLCPDIRFLLAAPYPFLLPKGGRPPNLRVRRVLDQKRLLPQCAAMLSHGGLGSLKEAIFAGVPTIALPSFGDQFFNAMRIRHHWLGDGLFEGLQTPADVARILGRVLDGDFAEPMDAMKAAFSAASQEHPACALVQAVLLDSKLELSRRA